MTDTKMYLDTPTIASDPIYVGPPTTLTLEDDVGRVRVWSEGVGEWIDHEWKRDGDELMFVRDPSTQGFLGTVLVCEMLPVGGERPDLGDYGPEVE